MSLVVSCRGKIPIMGGLWALLLLGLCSNTPVQGQTNADNQAVTEPQLSSSTFKFVDVDVHYQRYESSKPESPLVLFLHGRAFTSDIWVKLGTLQAVAQAGFRPMAVDIPGYGRTRHLPYVDNNIRAEFIKAALEFGETRNLTAMLVSPSMSGKWSVPFLDRYGGMLGAWVAVAPVGVRGWGGPGEFTHKQVQLLAVYGQEDSMIKDSAYVSKLFSKAQEATIQGAGHACYLDKPQEFNELLVTFLRGIDATRRVEDPHKDRDL